MAPPLLKTGRCGAWTKKKELWEMFANGEANTHALPDFFALEGGVRNVVLEINLNELNKEYE